MRYALAVGSFFGIWFGLWWAGWFISGYLFPRFETPALIGGYVGCVAGALVAHLIIPSIGGDDGPGA